MVCPIAEFLPDTVTQVVKFEDIKSGQLPTDAPGLLAGLNILHLGKTKHRIPEFEPEYVDTIRQRHARDFDKFNY